MNFISQADFSWRPDAADALWATDKGCYFTNVHKFIHFVIMWFLVKIQNSNQTKRTKLENVYKEIETRYKKAAGIVTGIYQRNE